MTKKIKFTVLTVLSVLLILSFCGCSEADNNLGEASNNNETDLTTPTEPENTDTEEPDLQPEPIEDELPDPIIVENVETGGTHYEYVDPIPENTTKEEPSNNMDTVEQFEYEPLSMFQVVSADDALRITGGKITPCPDYNQNGWSAYLTPSGMLVYMDEWLYGRLPEGTNDFTVDMYAGEGGNIGVQAMDSRYDNANVIDIEETLVELDGIKCTVYVSTNDMNEIICYGIPNEGRVVYSYGFNVKSDDYKDHTLKIKVFNSSDEFEEFVGPTDSTVYVGYRSRYMGKNPTMPEWNVTAEICTAHGEVVHTEEFKVRECREMNGVLLQMLPR